MEDLTEFTGLVIKTASMFYKVIGMEREDLEQELWVKVLKSKRAFDPSRSKMSVHSYTYSCIANHIKTLKRDAWRRRNRADIQHYEDMPNWERILSSAERGHDAHGIPDFNFPDCVTDMETQVAFLLVIGYTQTEAAGLLGVECAFVKVALKSLREKLAYLRPEIDESGEIVVAEAAA